jgi:hypothetical protein
MKALGETQDTICTADYTMYSSMIFLGLVFSFDITLTFNADRVTLETIGRFKIPHPRIDPMKRGLLFIITYS